MIDRRLSFDRDSHSADAIQRAAYKFSDRMSLDLMSDDDAFRCTLAFEGDEVAFAEVVHDFRREVLDQVLRERIRDETAAVRNTILALAFSKTSLVSPD
jgi:His-Xaa-Ser system protein HxsD